LNLKSFSLLLLILFAMLFQANADTIDYYHVYYNNIIIKENPRDTTPISFKKTEIKETDSLSVRYWTDTPCASCKFYLVVIDEKNIYVKVTSALGQGTPLSISMQDILDWSVENSLIILIFIITKKSLLIQFTCSN
jgi:hypothetical protein